MYLVKSYQGREWISGVFTDLKEVMEYQARVIVQGHDVGCVMEELDLPFPLFIVEQEVYHVEDQEPERTFRFMQALDLAMLMTSDGCTAEPVPSPCTIYKINGPWQPPHDQAGLDYMGGMDHMHLTENNLEDVAGWVAQ